jgi:hypothetical protein
MDTMAMSMMSGPLLTTAAAPGATTTPGEYTGGPGTMMGALRTGRQSVHMQRRQQQDGQVGVSRPLGTQLYSLQTL